MTTAIKTIPENRPLPLATNLRDGCTLIGLNYETARKHGLLSVWQDEGIIWQIPGTDIKRVVVSRLQEWVERTNAAQHPGQEF